MATNTKSNRIPTIDRGVSAVRAPKARTEAASQLETLLGRLEEIGDAMTPSERANIPNDFAKNIEHYLYGAPKE